MVLNEENYKNQTFTICIQDGIVFVEILKEFMDFTDVDAMIKKYHEMVRDRSFPVILDFCSMKTATLEASRRMGDKEAEKGIVAVAVVTRFKIHKIIYDLYCIKYKKTIPLKGFTSGEKALKWIEKYKQKTKEYKHIKV